MFYSFAPLSKGFIYFNLLSVVLCLPITGLRYGGGLLFFWFFGTFVCFYKKIGVQEN